MIGSQVREYVFRKLLGEGGMGSVYLAEHTLLRQTRAIKLLHHDFTRNASVVRRFVNEARAVAKLRGRDGKPHRNLIQVYELFQDNETWFMVMEHLEGSTLTKAIDAGPMPIDRVVHAVGGIANALKIAHANGVIHRDLKPDNVFVTSRESDRSHIVLLDFGVAQLRNDPEAGPITKAGVLIGTPHFMAPEQLAGQPITVRTDIFALGILGYMMATGGKHPWQYEDATTFYTRREPELYVRMTQHAPIDPRRHVPLLTDAQAHALLAPLQHEPSRRPASATTYALALADSAPTDGVRTDGLEIISTRYPELLEIDDLSETLRSSRPSSMPLSLSSSGLEQKYKLVRKLGAGGMAEVYLGTTLGIEGFARPVAIKRIFTGFDQSEAFAKLFIREAQMTARLSHPNIVPVLDFSRDPQNRLFLVMEYVDGKDLAAILEAGPLSPSLAIFIATEILRGLGYAHASTSGGLVHRDISPHNVMVSYEGEVKICDFGLARMVAASNASSSSRAGKPAYMSPEQANGEEDVDGRADLFAVGIILWEMLTGKRLFSGTYAEALAQVLVKPIDPPSLVRPGVPAALDANVLRLLARDRAARYQRAEDATQDLLKSEHAVADGRGELVTTVATRFPRPGSAAPDVTPQIPAPDAPRMPSPVTVSERPAQPMPPSTLSAFTGESAVHRSGARRAGVLLGAILLGVAIITVAAIKSPSRDHGATTSDESNRTATVPNSLDDAAAVGSLTPAHTGSTPPLDARMVTPSDATVVVLTPDAAPAAPTDAATTIATMLPDAGSQSPAIGAGAPSVAHPTPTPVTGTHTSPARENTTHVAAPPLAKGQLSVSCDPWCEIWIDGVKRASTVSKRFTLTVGTHVVRLVHPDLKADATKRIVISAEQEAVIEQTF